MAIIKAKHIAAWAVSGVLLACPLWSRTPRIRVWEKPAAPADAGFLYAPGDTIVFQYYPDFETVIIQPDSPAVNLLVQEGLQGRVLNVPMAQKEIVWETRFVPTDSAAQILIFCFQHADSLESVKDDNEGECWDMLAEDGRGNSARGAWQARASSFTGMGGLRQEKLDLAQEAADRELALYPGNHAARILQYTIRLRQSGNSRGERESIGSETAALLKERPDDRDVQQMAINAFRLIGRRDLAEKIEKQFIAANPGSEEAALKDLNAILKIEEDESRYEKLLRFVENRSQSPLAEYALSQMVTAAMSLQDTSRMTAAGDRLLAESRTPAGASALAGLAGTLSETNAEIPRAAAYARKALDILEGLKPDSRPPEMTEQEWDQQMKLTRSRYQAILGWTWVRQNRLQDGIAMLQQASDQVYEAGLFYHLARAMDLAGDQAAASLNLAKAAAFGGAIGRQAETELDDRVLKGKLDAAEKSRLLSSQAAWVEQNYISKILSARSVRPAPDFDLSDLEGEQISLSDQIGSVVLLCFWGTWSESSKRLMQDLQDLMQDYGGEVLFLSVAMDKKPEPVQSFLRKNRIAMTVLLNENLEKLYGLQGVPVLFVIDQDGNIHFEHKGYRPDILQVLDVELRDLLGG
jgi:peroxiredoxin